MPTYGSTYAYYLAIYIYANNMAAMLYRKYQDRVGAH